MIETRENAFGQTIGGQNYLLGEICPNAVSMAEDIADLIHIRGGDSASLHVLELGSGTGMSAIPILTKNGHVFLNGVDFESKMLAEARKNLAVWIREGRVVLNESDALSCLQSLKSDSAHYVTSVYAIHNFECAYRSQVLREIFRVLKPGGMFLNGDRYAMDDLQEHLTFIEQERAWYIQRLTELGRDELIEPWVEHLMSDQEPSRIMVRSPAIQAIKQCGFINIQETPYFPLNGVDIFVIAEKPGNHTLTD